MKRQSRSYKRTVSTAAITLLVAWRTLDSARVYTESDEDRYLEREQDSRIRGFEDSSHVIASKRLNKWRRLYIRWMRIHV